MFCKFIFNLIDNCKNFFKFIDVLIEIDFQIIDAFILLNIVFNVCKRIEIFVFKKNRKINVRKSFQFET